MIKAVLISWVVLCIAIFLGAYGVLLFEQQSIVSNIKTYGDALWWSVNVSSAVGDCDICPSTTGGRIVSTFLMFVGYALFSINIAAICSIFKHECEVFKNVPRETKITPEVVVVPLSKKTDNQF